MFRRIRASFPALPVILITAYGNTDEAVAAMRDGALYYFTKPVNFPLLLRLVRETLEKQALKAAVADLSAQLDDSKRRRILGSSLAIKAVIDQASAVAELETTVLLSGETGTGKELVAELIHAAAAARDRPFVAINCAALPETLLESELFGHERGRLHRRRRPQSAGLFEAADGGTLFLDEIGDMPLGAAGQAAAASWRTKPFERVGGTRARPGRRARSSPPPTATSSAGGRTGTFREDLFYRLNVCPVDVPPLRERADDIPLLAATLPRASSARAAGKSVAAFEPAALGALRATAGRAMSASCATPSNGR